MNERDWLKEMRIRQAQEERVAKQSWDFLDQNDPEYPAIVASRRRGDSVNDTRRRLGLEGTNVILRALWRNNE